MTTYSYTLELNDSEVIMLGAALQMMLEHCRHEIDVEPRAPFIAWQISAQDVLSRLDDNAQQTSANTLFRADDD
jgi:hypothetical protein